jgi:hypothetical protein
MQREYSKIINIIVLLFSVLIINGCTSNNVLIDPFVVFSEDEEPPVIDYSNLVDIEKRTFDIEKIASYDFSPSRLGIVASDDRDGNITSEMLIRRNGTKVFNGKNYYTVTYTSIDEAGNKSAIEVPFRVYEVTTINQDNLSDYFLLEYEYLGGISYLTNNTDAYFTVYLRPLTKIDSDQIIENNLSFDFDLSFYWTKEVTKRERNRSYGVSSENHFKELEINVEVPTDNLRLSELSYRKFPLNTTYIEFENTEFWMDSSYSISEFLVSDQVTFDKINSFTSVFTNGEVIFNRFITD